MPILFRVEVQLIVIASSRNYTSDMFRLSNTISVRMEASCGSRQAGLVKTCYTAGDHRWLIDMGADSIVLS